MIFWVKNWTDFVRRHPALYQLPHETQYRVEQDTNRGVKRSKLRQLHWWRGNVNPIFHKHCFLSSSSTELTSLESNLAYVGFFGYTHFKDATTHVYETYVTKQTRKRSHASCFNACVVLGNQSVTRGRRTCWSLSSGQGRQRSLRQLRRSELNGEAANLVQPLS